MKKFVTIIIAPFKWLYKLIDNVRISALLKHASINDIDKISGVDFENVVAYLFKKMHFKVSLTPPSRDFGADIIARKWGVGIAIQCKLYYNNNVGNKAVNEIYGAKSYYGCNFALIVTNSHYTKSAIDSATKLNVGLIDRNLLISLLKKPYSSNTKLIKNIIIKLSQKSKDLK